MISLLNKIKCIFWLCGTSKTKVDSKTLYKTEPVPKIIKGRRKWFNNGKEEKILFEHIVLEMGDEWKKGRLPKNSKKTSKNKKEK